MGKYVLFCTIFTRLVSVVQYTHTHTHTHRPKRNIRGFYYSKEIHGGIGRILNWSEEMNEMEEEERVEQKKN